MLKLLWQCWCSEVLSIADIQCRVRVRSEARHARRPSPSFASLNSTRLLQSLQTFGIAIAILQNCCTPSGSRIHYIHSIHALCLLDMFSLRAIHWQDLPVIFMIKVWSSNRNIVRQIKHVTHCVKQPIANSPTYKHSINKAQHAAQFRVAAACRGARAGRAFGFVYFPIKGS